MDTKARQLIADIWLGQKLTQVELDHAISVIRSEFTVLREFEHQYTPYGLTKVLILSESHCIIHTYPEQNFISIDLFVCDPLADLEGVLKKVLSHFTTKRIRHEVLDRGIEKTAPFIGPGLRSEPTNSSTVEKAPEGKPLK